MEVKSLLLQWKGKINQKSIEKYNYLQINYPTKIDESLFRSNYCSFYGLNYARLGEELKRKYFELLKNKENSLPKILETLYNIKTLRGINTYQFSFATKLIHTIYNDAPIYDSLVAGFFKFPPLPKKNNEKIDYYVNIYNLLKEEYVSLLQDKQIQQRIKEFKENYDARNISDAKMLDFVLWTMGKEKTGPLKEERKKRKMGSVK